MSECPVGFTIREAPEIYDVMDLCSVGENASPSELAAMPLWFQHAFRIYRSEMARIREEDEEARGLASDAEYGASVLRGR